VFVLSTGRAGTETLAALLGLAKNVISHHHPLPILSGLSKTGYKHFDNPIACEVLSEAFRAFRTDLLKESLDRGLGYVETSPQMTFLAPAILNALPFCKFIHLVRNPRHVVRSAMRRKWFDGHSNDKYRITPVFPSTAGQKWNTYGAFQKNLWLWNETNRWILQFLSVIHPDRKYFIHAEDMFSANDQTIFDLFNFIKAPTPSRQKMMKLLNKKLNAQKSGVFPRPSDWTDEMNNDLKKFTGGISIEFGYEL